MRSRRLRSFLLAGGLLLLPILGSSAPASSGPRRASSADGGRTGDVERKAAAARGRRRTTAFNAACHVLPQVVSWCPRPQVESVSSEHRRALVLLCPSALPPLINAHVAAECVHRCGGYVRQTACERRAERGTAGRAPRPAVVSRRSTWCPRPCRRHCRCSAWGSCSRHCCTGSGARRGQGRQRRRGREGERGSERCWEKKRPKNTLGR